MYSKIAFQNVKKSFKDYGIYFLTLTLAVCIFYSFNSIDAQRALMEVTETTAEFTESISNIMSYVSVFVAIILGSLILYANNFLIKKRNKELGIYMTLGMGKSKISKILIYETIMVGIVSLISGLILGLIASQGLSVLVAKLFEVGMTEYRFVVSMDAIWKTIMYFGIMFLLVMFFNTYIVSRYKIIDLLIAGRKTEEIKFKNPIINLIAFVLSAISLGIAYKSVMETGLNINVLSIILGIVGTLLFFFSLTGLILNIVKKNKKIYFKGLNIFTIKQINSKVNTNFVSMSVICLMLFITIVTLSTGLSFKAALEAGLKGATPYDASAYMYVYEDDPEDMVKGIEESFDMMGISISEDSKMAFFNEYKDGTKVVDVMPSIKDDVSIPSTVGVYYIKESQYNNIRALSNRESILLEDDEVLVMSNFSKIVPYVKKYLKENDTIKIKDKTYKVKNKEVIEENLKTDYMENNIFTIVVKDELCKNLELVSSNVNINFSNKDKSVAQKEFLTEIEAAYDNPNTEYSKVGYVIANTRDSIYEGNKGVTTTILFVVIYLGIVFLISSMAVLALQQLSEASDSIDRYGSLKKLGVNKKSIERSIFAQTLVYFSFPIILALVHSIVGIDVANEFISLYNKPDIGGASIITAGIFLVVYIVYFYTTYTGYKNIVKSKIK